MNTNNSLPDQSFLGRGWAFPVRLDPATGRIALSDYEQDIKEAIRIILATASGERVMRPEFGCGIHELPFEVVDTATAGRIEADVRDALLHFEPRIEVCRVSVRTDAEQLINGCLLVLIDYTVLDTNRDDNLVFPFYLPERG